MKLLKNIAVISVLVAFLLPASGVMLFMHHCSSMATTEISMDGSNSCCQTPSGLFRTITEQPAESCIEHQGNCTHHDYLTKQACCADGHLFVKIESDYLNTFYKTLQPEFNTIEVIERQPLSALSLAGFIFHNTTSAHDPPGLEIYLQVSSLRL